MTVFVTITTITIITVITIITIITLIITIITLIITISITNKRDSGLTINYDSYTIKYKHD